MGSGESQACRLVIFEASSCVRTVPVPYLPTGKAKGPLGCLVLGPILLLEWTWLVFWNFQSLVTKNPVESVNINADAAGFLRAFLQKPYLTQINSPT